MAGRIILANLVYDNKGKIDYTQMGAEYECLEEDVRVGGLIVTTGSKMWTAKTRPHAAKGSKTGSSEYRLQLITNDNNKKDTA